MFQRTIKVYLEDTDAQGVVYHANYFRFVERTFHDFLEMFDPNKQFKNSGLQFAFYSEQIRFAFPAKVGDRLKIILNFNKLSISSGQIDFEIRNGTRLIANGNFVFACVDEEHKLKTIPTWAVQRAQAFFQRKEI